MKYKLYFQKQQFRKRLNIWQVLKKSFFSVMGWEFLYLLFEQHNLMFFCLPSPTRSQTGACVLNDVWERLVVRVNTHLADLARREEEERKRAEEGENQGEEEAEEASSDQKEETK